MNKTVVLLIFGTRPEAIKMAPVILELQKHPELFDTKVCITAQHREMLDQVIEFFKIKADYDLNLMRPGQNLFGLTADIITNMEGVLENCKPDIVLVHGDTTTSTIAALAAFYFGTKTGHVEAGLRTFNKMAPFPEEINRQITGRLADIHFAPTNQALENLTSEGISAAKVVVTGNTVIDALQIAQHELEDYTNNEIKQLQNLILPDKKIILVTGHRRENFGEGFLNICVALKNIALKENVHIIYPVHLNPNVQKPVFNLLGNIDNVSLINPLSYPAFVWLMLKCHMIITDSGGVQEEAPSLGKPVLVMRDTTERPEALEAGSIAMVGTNTSVIERMTADLLSDEALYKRMSNTINPYGDGKASQRIVQALMQINRSPD
jgi:UDP-N-acetylglucosamine 2-epimerase (non-hydrolysing)